MLNVVIIAVGKIKDKWTSDGIKEYAKRLTPYCRFNILEIGEHRLSLNPSEAEIIAGLKKEGIEIASKIPSRSKVVALCIEGEKLSSKGLARLLSDYSNQSSTITFIIGSSFGLSAEVKSSADLKLSVSDMTFPHQLLRLLLSEQIYRGLSIVNGSKYHK